MFTITPSLSFFFYTYMYTYVYSRYFTSHALKNKVKTSEL